MNNLSGQSLYDEFVDSLPADRQKVIRRFKVTIGENNKYYPLWKNELRTLGRWGDDEAYTELNRRGL